MGGPTQERLLPVGIRDLPEGRWQFLFPPRPPNPTLEVLSLEEVRPLLVAFSSLGLRPRPQLRLLELAGANRTGLAPASP